MFAWLEKRAPTRRESKGDKTRRARWRSQPGLLSICLLLTFPYIIGAPPFSNTPAVLLPTLRLPANLPRVPTYQRSTNAAYILPLLRTTTFAIPFHLRAVRDHATADDSGNDRLLVRPLSVRCRVYDLLYLIEISQVLRERWRSPRGRSGVWKETDESMESSSSAATATATVWRRFLPLLLVSSASFIEWIDSRSRTSSCSRSRSRSRSRSNSRSRSWSWPG